MSIKLFAYAMARALGVFALCRRLSRSRMRILAYHGASLGDEGAYNPLLFISTETFQRRIDWLQRKGFHVISLDQAVDALDGKGRVPALSTVVTFDDGWHSTATRLIPILAERNLPSTLYLHTAHFEEDWPVLPVVVGYMLWRHVNTMVAIAGFAAAMDGTYRLKHKTDRDALVHQSCAWLESPPATRQTITNRLCRLADSLGLDADDLGLQTRRFDYMSRDELLEIAGHLCAIELHGHEHHYPAGDPEAFAADLDQCRSVIVGLGLPVPRHYCYPSGAFDAAAGATLDRFGVRSGTTCLPGFVRPVRDASRHHYLPRFLDGENIDMLVFEAEMSGFAGLLRRMAGR